MQNKTSQISKNIMSQRHSIAFYILLFFICIFYSSIFDDARAHAFSNGEAQQAFLVILSSASCVLFFFILMMNRWVFLISLPIVFYIGAVSQVLYSKLGISITPSVAPILFNDSAMFALIKATDKAPFIIIMFIFAIFLGFIRVFHARDKVTKRKAKAFGVFILLTILSTYCIETKFPNYTPMPYLFFKSATEFYVDKLKSENIEKIGEKSHISAPEDVFFTVLIIEKMPPVDISKMSLISKENVATFGDKLAGEQDYRKIAEFMQVGSLKSLSKNNFSTQWVTAANIFITPDKNIKKLAKSSNKYILKNNPTFPNPFLGIDYLNEFIEKNSGGVFVLNVEGALDNFSSRYPEQFSTNNEPDSAESGEQNYINFIDASVYEIIKTLKTKKSVLAVLILNSEGEANKDESTLLLWVSSILDERGELKKEILSDDKKNISLADIINATYSFENKSKK